MLIGCTRYILVTYINILAIVIPSHLYYCVFLYHSNPSPLILLTSHSSKSFFIKISIGGLVFAIVFDFYNCLYTNNSTRFPKFDHIETPVRHCCMTRTIR